MALGQTETEQSLHHGGQVHSFEAGKPARQLRTKWTEAWEEPDAPDTLPMPLQGILHQEAGRRTQRVGSRALIGFPVGQIVGRMNKVRPSRDLVLEMVEEWIETTQRLQSLLGDD